MATGDLKLREFGETPIGTIPNQAFVKKEGVETMREVSNKNMFDKDIVQLKGSHSINENVVESKLCELGEYLDPDETTPNQAFLFLNRKEGVEIRLGGLPKEDSLVKIARKVLLGTMLGDSCIRKTSSEKAYILLGHSVKQVEYLFWKARILSYFTGKFVLDEEWKSYGDRQDLEKTCLIRLRSLSSKYLKHIYDDFYRNSVKVMRKNVLNRLTPVSIAVWYGDDGELVWGYNKENIKIPYSVRLATQSFTCEETEFACNWFYARFGIQFHVITCPRTNRYIMVTDKANTHKFLDLISPYISHLTCMGYKLDPNKNHSDHSAEYSNLQRLKDLNNDIIRTPGKSGRPFGFKLTSKAKLRISNRVKTQWAAKNLEKQTEMSVRSD